ncbi:hypothetical protein ASPWEDRAFT_183476 [Aspergillus wentii DTO 134E9]|uniref:Myb-like domain-containing protein n=1 Tax=Aspergillus wentii DTO 134E9 TaxID=1073089 RepID=A0A1L9RKF3_ASPWE|nr:uncharacterized protein ASPWEDRAFT_183476 [Aspergillus wentii DTO 134E9]OJJ35416.1 hypothetical protein ASPWEDRAFT_183476 [Aspergillus wentii DTO 134E9]
MPVFVVDGKFYRVPLTSLFKANKAPCEQWLDCDATKVQTNKASKSGISSPQPPTITQIPGTGSSPGNREEVKISHKKVGDAVPAWSAEEDKLLRELRAYRLPWNQIAVTLDRSIEDVKEHWSENLYGKSRKVKESESTRHVEYRSPEGDAETTKVEEKPKRHVSFSNPLVTAGDIDDEGNGPPPKIKKVYYIDEEFTLEDVVLLHNIAAKWERDRWLAISTRFNDKTGRNITPEQAKSVIDN